MIQKNPTLIYVMFLKFQSVTGSRWSPVQCRYRETGAPTQLEDRTKCIFVQVRLPRVSQHQQRLSAQHRELWYQNNIIIFVIFIRSEFRSTPFIAVLHGTWKSNSKIYKFKDNSNLRSCLHGRQRTISIDDGSPITKWTVCQCSGLYMIIIGS